MGLVVSGLESRGSSAGATVTNGRQPGTGNGQTSQAQPAGVSSSRLPLDRRPVAATPAALDRDDGPRRANAGSSRDRSKGTSLRPMKVVVVGATGHIGSYLVPRLVAAGHEVVAISRGSQ